VPILAGVLLGAASCGLHAALPAEQGRALAAVVVGALGGVYVGGALRGGMRIEFAVACVAAMIFAVLGAAGLIGPAWIIAGAFILHGVWDWVHHALERRTVGPWWPPFCAIIDFIFGTYLLVVQWRSGW